MKKTNEKSESIQRGNMEMVVTETMHEIGVPASLLGYRYIREAVLLLISNRNAIKYFSKAILTEVARKHDTTYSRVERAIRHAIEVAWERGDVDTLHKYFGSTISDLRGKPTNKEFIAMIADNVTMRQKHGMV